MFHPRILRKAAPLGVLLALPLVAQTVPGTINYQGRLTDNSPSQAPVTAVVSMKFEIYDVASGGTPLWEEPASGGVNVSVTGGVFSYQLGSTEAIPTWIFMGASSTRYLQITLNPGPSQELLTPRQRISASGYAKLADNATYARSSDLLGPYPASYFLSSTGTAYNSLRLDGIDSIGWQRILTIPSCPANQFYSAIAQNGTATCAAPPGIVETDPEVGPLTTGRVPRWNGTALVNGTLFDSGTNLGVGTTAPFTQFQVGGRLAYLGSAAATTPISVFAQGRYAYVAGNFGLSIFEISDPAVPKFVGYKYSGMSDARSVFVQGRYAYLTTFAVAKLAIIDISNPSVPVTVGAVGLSSPASVYVQGNYAYVASWGSLKVIDVSNPASPSITSSVTTNLVRPEHLSVHGRFAYIADPDANALVIYDVSDPVNPAFVGLATAGLSSPRSVYVQDRYAYVASYGNARLVIYDISDPANPASAGFTSTGMSSPFSVQVHGRYAYVADNTGNKLSVVDIANPASPAYLGSISTGLSNPLSVFVQGRTAYLASANNNAMVSIDLGGAYAQQFEAGGAHIGSLAISGNAQIDGDFQVNGGIGVGTGGVNSAGIIAAPTFVGALKGNASTATAATTATSAASFSGALLGDVTGTQGATTVGKLQGRPVAATAPTSNQFLRYDGTQWHPAAVIESDPKIGTMSDGRVPRWNAGSGQLESGAMFDGGVSGNLGVGTSTPITQLHVDGRAQIAGSSSTPPMPVAVYSQGRYVFVVGGNVTGELRIFDIKNPASPYMTDSIQVSSGLNSVFVHGQYVYVTSHGSDELLIFRYSPPISVMLVGRTSSGLLDPRAVHVSGRYAYVASAGNSRLVVFDISNPALPVNVGSTGAGLNYPTSVQVEGKFAYVTSGLNNSLVMFDISDPANPAFSFAWSQSLSFPSAVQVRGRLAYVASTNNHSLVIYDLENAFFPLQSVTTTGLSNPDALQVQGRYAYLTHSGGLVVFDISNPATPTLVRGTAASIPYPKGLHVQGRYAYLAGNGDNKVYSVDLGGAYIQQLEAGGLQTDSLAVDHDAQIMGDVQIRGGLNVGEGGINSAGGFGLSGQLRYASGSPGSGKVLTSDPIGNASWQPLPTGNPGTVTSVTANAPLSVTDPSSAPVISLTGVVSVANGGTGSSTQNFVDLTTPQTVGGTKTFSSPIAGSVTGTASNVTGVVAVSNGGTGSSTQNFVDLTTPQTVGGTKTFSSPIAGSVTGTASNVTGVVAVSNGGTGSSTQNFVDLTTPQTVGGTKTFSNPIAGSVTGTASNVTGVVAVSNGGTGSPTQNFVDLTTPQTVGGTKTFSNPIAGSVTGTASNVTGVVGVSNGGTGSSTQNFVDLTTPQTVGGTKTFSSPIAGSVTGTASNVTGVVAVSNGGTGSSTQNFVDLTTPQTVGGTKTFSSPIAGSVTGTAANVTGVVAVSNGGTGSSTQNFVDLTALQTVGGTKTFSNPIVGSVTGTAANVTGVVAVSNGGTGSSTQNFVDLTTPQTVGGAKSFSGSAFFSAAGTGLTVSNTAVIGVVETGSVQKTSGTLALAATGANAITASTNGTERLRIDSTGGIRAPGTLRQGSESGTTEAPLVSGVPAGLVVRRINSTNAFANSVVARTDQLTFERDGTNGGFILRYGASPGYQLIACQGITSAAVAVNFYQQLGNPVTGGTITVYDDGQGLVHFRCSMGNTYGNAHLAEFTLTRFGTDNYWSGSIITTYNQ